jgi:DNA-binding transcriptional LysR family regulator
MISLCRNAGFEPQISQEAIRTTTAASFVSAGLGLTLMPESLKGVVPRGVVYRPLSSPAPTTQILVAHRTGLASPTVAGLMAVIQDLLHVPSRSG